MFLYIKSTLRGVTQGLGSIAATLTAAAAKGLSGISATGKWVNANKGVVILILALLNAFGMIAPDTATGLRDALLGLG